MRKKDNSKINLNQIYKKSINIVSRRIENELLLVPIFKTDSAINEMYSLNATAAVMWRLIDGKRSLKVIIAELQKIYDSPREEIQSKLLVFIRDLKEINAVEEK